MSHNPKNCLFCQLEANAEKHPCGGYEITVTSSKPERQEHDGVKV